MVSACGWTVDSKPSKNAEAKKLFDAIMAAIRSMKCSDGALTWFKELQQHLFDTRQKLKNIAPSRWSSVVKVRPTLGVIQASFHYFLIRRLTGIIPPQVLRAVLANWTAIKQAYYNQFEKELPFGDQHAVIKQLYSLLVAVVKVIKACQAHEHPSVVSGYYALIRLRTVELDLRKPLPLIDPTSEEIEIEVIREAE